ncbi:acetyltransferase (GNAT) family protein [Luteibacter rhizovicinus]|uniref:Acetyltransferase (GNAT) family protein n=1 Tax=Luteibacter rhizovicinus TaxID=242606 RepID=A0A4R3YN36_9GAMM|nr:GNAT family N-acetyltransferase [Luteibacter rhizovicinus]TCV94057.1 acetyltransferase (GNAT) family protein [Luteibacter rhizovicinus]
MTNAPTSKTLSPGFRYATSADVSAIVGLVESAYRGAASRAGWTTEADLLAGRRTDAEEIGQLLAGSEGRFVLLEEGGELLASCYIEKKGDACYFGMFSVRPLRQGGGIGRRVVAEVERLARQDWACSSVEMAVIDVRDELMAWYGRRGYARTGRFSPFPYGDERFGIPLRDDLRFEYVVKPLGGEA